MGEKMDREFKEFSEKPRFLEIGIGYGPFYKSIKSNRGDSISLIGIDIQTDWLKRLKQDNPNLPLVETNARLLPFADETFDSVVLNSVLGGPDEDWYMRHKEPEKKEFASRKWEIVMEGFRVLKSGGRLKIFELYSLVREDVFWGIIERLNKEAPLLKVIRDDEDLLALKRSKKPFDAAWVFEKLRNK